MKACPLLYAAYLGVCILAALWSIHLASHDGAAVSQAALVLHRQAQLGQGHGLEVSLSPPTCHEGLQQLNHLQGCVYISLISCWMKTRGCVVRPKRTLCLVVFSSISSCPDGTKALFSEIWAGSEAGNKVHWGPIGNQLEGL